MKTTKMTAVGKKRKQLEDHLEENGWKQDRYGHWHKEVNGAKVRFKMQDISCRMEKQVNICGKNEWRNMRNKVLYYKNFRVTENGLISFSGE